MTRKINFVLTAILLIAAKTTTPAQIAAGGAFQLEQTVIASGGGVSINTASGNIFKIEGTAGQSIAGRHSTGSPFSVRTGFWLAEPSAPTSANVIVGGKVTTSDGRGIRNVLVTLTGANGEVRTVLTGAFGFYRFADVPAGETYVFTVSAKRYVFAQTSQIRTVLEEINDINFVAEIRHVL